MRFARHDLFGRVLEVREGEMGEHLVLVNGRVVSKKAFGWWTSGSSHFFDLEDEHGATRHIEVQVRSWRFTRTPAIVLIDGVEAFTLALVGKGRAARLCPHCGYALGGLPIDNDEVRCPECGRHASARLLGLSKGARSVPGQAGARGA